jgi:hypothetical protein
MWALETCYRRGSDALDDAESETRLLEEHMGHVMPQYMHPRWHPRWQRRWTDLPLMQITPKTLQGCDLWAAACVADVVLHAGIVAHPVYPTCYRDVPGARIDGRPAERCPMLDAVLRVGRGSAGPVRARTLPPHCVSSAAHTCMSTRVYAPIAGSRTKGPAPDGRHHLPSCPPFCEPQMHCIGGTAGLAWQDTVGATG